MDFDALLDELEEIMDKNGQLGSENGTPWILSETTDAACSEKNTDNTCIPHDTVASCDVECTSEPSCSGNGKNMALNTISDESSQLIAVKHKKASKRSRRRSRPKRQASWNPSQKLTEEQLEILEKVHRINPLPSKEERKELAAQLKMSNTKVKEWFNCRKYADLFYRNISTKDDDEYQSKIISSVASALHPGAFRRKQRLNFNVRKVRENTYEVVVSPEDGEQNYSHIPYFQNACASNKMDGHVNGENRENGCEPRMGDKQQSSQKPCHDTKYKAVSHEIDKFVLELEKKLLNSSAAGSAFNAVIPYLEGGAASETLGDGHSKTVKMHTVGLNLSNGEEQGIPLNNEHNLFETVDFDPI